MDNRLFRALQPARLGELVNKIEKLVRDLAGAEDKCENAAPSRRDSLGLTASRINLKLADAKQEYCNLADTHRIEAKLWTGTTVEAIPLRWANKRLISDLAIHGAAKRAHECMRIIVARADRLGRASKGAGSGDEVSLAGLFEQDHWNGRLQSPRSQLDAIAQYIDNHGWDEVARSLVARIRWLISFSAELRARTLVRVRRTHGIAARPEVLASL